MLEVRDMQLVDVVRKAVKSVPLAYLTVGPKSLPIAQAMNGLGATGINIQSRKPSKDGSLFMELWSSLKNDRHMQVVAHITPDPRLVQMLDGFWYRSLTLEEVFVQYPGPYKVFAAIDTNQDRAFLEHKCIKACDPKVIIIGEDGNNKELVKSYSERGYRCQVVDEALVMVKP